MKILVIEDNERNAYLVRYLLESAGFSVHWAATGRDGIDWAVREPFDLVLLDIQLPEMDGYTVASNLRKNPETRKIPIVAVTSYALAGDREKAIAAGCTGYLEKPIDPETFISDVRQFFPSPDQPV